VVCAGVEAAHRRRLAAAQRPAEPSPAVHDDELVDLLMTAAGNNVLTGGIHDVAPIRAMLADGVALDDILSTLRTKVHRGVAKYAETLSSWGEHRFLRHVALAYLSRTVVPAMVEAWSRGAPGEAAGRVKVPAAVSQFDWSALVEGFRAGTLQWNEERLGPEPGALAVVCRYRC
jgi:hypothetical protein